MEHPEWFAVNLLLAVEISFHRFPWIYLFHVSSFHHARRSESYPESTLLTHCLLYLLTDVHPLFLLLSALRNTLS
jgi:hypothetical protein